MMPFLHVILHGLYGTFYCLSVLDQKRAMQPWNVSYSLASWATKHIS